MFILIYVYHPLPSVPTASQSTSNLAKLSCIYSIQEGQPAAVYESKKINTKTHSGRQIPREENSVSVEPFR